MKGRSLSILVLIFTFLCQGLGQKELVQDPIHNFEMLWKEFDLRYANFELKKVNWKEIYKSYRPMVNENTTNQELFDISCSMLQELRDGHVTIEPNFNESDIECGAPYDFQLEIEFSTEEEIKQFASCMNSSFINNGFSSPTKFELTEDTNFQYRTSENLAYLRLDEMTEKLTFGKFQKSVDSAIDAFQTKKGLILDLRFNGGGWDYNAYQLAGRFVPAGVTVGHYERARIKGKNEFSSLEFKSISSKGKLQFTQTIIILVSDFTASASEVFLLLVKDLPNVILVGDNSEGIFSDMSMFKLPNKWKVSLSDQQYFSQDMVNYEGLGIEPDIRSLNVKSDLLEGNDPVLEQAIDILLAGKK